MCFRIKLAEERVADIEKEKLKLEAKLAEITKNMENIKNKETILDEKSQEVTATMTKENMDLKSKINEIRKEKMELQSKMDEITISVEKFEKQVTKCEKNILNLEEEIVNKDKELKNLRGLKSEKVGLEMTVKDLQRDLKLKDEEIKRGTENSKELMKLRREKENMETKIKNLEKDVADLKSKETTLHLRRTSDLESVEDLKQEKRYMESRISTLQRQVEQGDGKLVDMERKLAQLTKDNEKLQGSITENFLIVRCHVVTTLMVIKDNFCYICTFYLLYVHFRNALAGHSSDYLYMLYLQKQMHYFLDIFRWYS